MASDERKMSSLTKEYQFAGVVGNLVLLRDGKTGKLLQGNRQKCHFYEGIFAMRQPPKQQNPIALVEEERSEIGSASVPSEAGSAPRLAAHWGGGLGKGKGARLALEDEHDEDP